MDTRSSDEVAIRALLDLQGEGWRRADGGLFASAFAEDAEFTNVVGKTLHGRAEIASHHQRLFDGVYKGSEGEVGEPRIRFIHGDVATVESEVTLRFEEGVRHAHGLTVAVRNGANWEIAATHNMIPVAPLSS